MNEKAGRSSGHRIRKMVTLGIMSAIAFAAVALISIPAVSFLRYEPKDVIITIAGFIYGPFSSFIISLVVGLIEMVTISPDGPIGLVMNVIASSAFACTAAVIYRRKQTMAGAVAGLLAGLVCMTAFMLLWNFLVTPYYMGVPRQAVAEMLAPVFLPFNLIKGAINSAITLLLYKPLVTALRKARLIPESTGRGGIKTGKANMGVMLAAALVLASCVLLILVWQNVL